MLRRKFFSGQFLALFQKLVTDAQQLLGQINIVGLRIFKALDLIPRVSSCATQCANLVDGGHGVDQLAVFENGLK